MQREVPFDCTGTAVLDVTEAGTADGAGIAKDGHFKDVACICKVGSPGVARAHGEAYALAGEGSMASSGP
ncbi:MAG: hypothetical protein M3R70_10090 [Actinomycetota bacterium]|nr:hypothetical protein [Actinomycetota bacterium]